jgi:hypothetical protein
VQISIETTSVGWYTFPHENPTGYLDENQYTRALNTYLSKSPYPGMPLVCILLVGVNLHPPAAPTSTPCKTDSVCGYETLYDCICVPWLKTVANYGG